MVALPTGYGKSLPMLLLGLLMPEGGSAVFAPQEPDKFLYHRLHDIYCPTSDNNWSSAPKWVWSSGHPCGCWKPGNYCFVLNLKICCLYSKIVHNNSLQIAPEDFGAAMARRPKIVIANFEFLAHREVWTLPWSDISTCVHLWTTFAKVRNVILDHRGPRGVRPVVAIDEAQVSPETL